MNSSSVPSKRSTRWCEPRRTSVPPPSGSTSSKKEKSFTANTGHVGWSKPKSMCHPVGMTHGGRVGKVRSISAPGFAGRCQPPSPKIASNRALHARVVDDRRELRATFEGAQAEAPLGRPRRRIRQTNVAAPLDVSPHEVADGRGLVRAEGGIHPDAAVIAELGQQVVVRHL